MFTQKKHLISLLSYIGVGFISGAISHGFFSGTRSIVMATIGIILFITGEYLKWETKSYFELFMFALIYSIAVGMASWWFQHFLDSPMRSLWIIPIGYLISLMVYPYKEWLHGYNLKKSLIWWIIIRVLLYFILYGALHLIQQVYFAADHNDD